MKKLILASFFSLCLHIAFGQGADTTWNTMRIAAMEAKRWQPDQRKSETDYNGQNYDWKYVECYWDIDPEVKYISGRVVHTIEILSPADTVFFDFSDAMQINSITSQGTSLNYFFSDEFSLGVVFPGQISVGETKIEIDYQGEPQNNTLLSFNQGFHGTEPEIYTLSEPYGARDWWPCKQELNDKVDSILIEITVPDGIKAGSNGVLEYEVANPDATVSFGWKHRYPIPAYLVSIAATNYDVFEQSATVGGNEIDIINYVYPERYDLAISQLEPLPQLIEFFSSRFGVYPYWNEKYGHSQASLPGGMEHTTMSTMAGFYYSLVAHELAHQWFGDKVTCGSWQDIWLNEGFATFLTGLSYEGLQDENQFINWKSGLQQSVKSQPGGSVFVTDTTDRGRIFDGRLTYNKGAYLLIMLRTILGDADFFEACRNYLNDPNLAFGYARTRDLQMHMEAVSGKDLSQFFTNWFFGEGYPTYSIDWSPTSGGVVLTVSQSTSHASVDFFKLPVPIELIGDERDTIIQLDNIFSGQHFFIPTQFAVREIRFDPKLNILADGRVRYSPDTDLDPNEVQVSPNPANKSIRVSLLNPAFEAKTLQIFDSQGKLIIEQSPGGGIHEAMEIDVTQLSEGVYIIRLMNANSMRSTSFVVTGS